ncbi:acylphosphatase [Vibrio aquaticus]|uniref:Acylphosphatase n=1 Tax=Vibrio aquaticus TaxID=2496559 RepID=A0A3S0MKH8_9VIBR|nr:acylphosphatase [Vibrio aquaticus]RTZ16911.1 acylphosphatase [Vibrio aquaticus]
MVQSCEKFLIEGLVQGVGFRYSTSYEGLKIGLAGYAKNLANGDVEVIACGTQEQIERLAVWLQNGPRTARVDKVSREPVSYKPFKGFKVL